MILLKNFYLGINVIFYVVHFMILKRKVDVKSTLIYTVTLIYINHFCNVSTALTVLLH